MIDNLKTTEILGVKVTTSSQKEILEYITKSLKNLSARKKNNKKKIFIVTPNPEIIVYSHHHPNFKKIVNSAQIALPDGVGVQLAAELLGKDIKERITGVDFMDNLCGTLSKRIETVGFLGGLGGVAEKTANCLQKKYPGLKVAFAGSEWPSDLRAGRSPQVENDAQGSALVAHENFLARNASKGKSTNQRLVASARNENFVSSPRLLNIDVLFVAFGFPKQEEWIYQNLPTLPVKVAMGVGGAFDYISGRVDRAPGFVRALGFEWLYRLIRQPWRIKRHLALLEFIYLILLEKITPLFPFKK